MAPPAYATAPAPALQPQYNSFIGAAPAAAEGYALGRAQSYGAQGVAQVQQDRYDYPPQGPQMAAALLYPPQGFQMGAALPNQQRPLPDNGKKKKRDCCFGPCLEHRRV